MVLHYLTQFFALVGSSVAAASALSLMFPKDSIIGEWVAWYASMPLKHRPTKKEIGK